MAIHIHVFVVHLCIKCIGGMLTEREVRIIMAARINITHTKKGTFHCMSQTNISV